jgi:hypothetical protein
MRPTLHRDLDHEAEVREHELPRRIDVALLGPAYRELVLLLTRDGRVLAQVGQVLREGIGELRPALGGNARGASRSRRGQGLPVLVDLIGTRAQGR